jgi:restriction endonuclease Mrr
MSNGSKFIAIWWVIPLGLSVALSVSGVWPVWSILLTVVILGALYLALKRS